MNPILAWLNGWEVVAILAVVLIIFGAKKLPELARGLGQGIKEFKKSSREIQDEIQRRPVETVGVCKGGGIGQAPLGRLGAREARGLGERDLVEADIDIHWLNFLPSSSAVRSGSQFHAFIGRHSENLNALG